ncbi:hypothetical protein SEEA0322_17923 [Salmonella enterica subsp. enterica serovar Agona str. 0322]|nr:hypothetical protein SEEA0322_17923 [Salmonella enterica subsp. enterica serovar Agona str. 0322]
MSVFYSAAAFRFFLPLAGQLFFIKVLFNREFSSKCGSNSKNDDLRFSQSLVAQV